MKLSAFVRRGDIITAAVVISISLILMALLYIPRHDDNGRLYVAVTYAEKTEYYPLDRETVITVVNNGYTATITIKNNEADVTGCDCPDQICVNTAPIHETGSVIVCVPAGILIKIISDGGNDADFVAG